MTGAAGGAGNAYPFGAPDFTSGFHRGLWIWSFDCFFCLVAWYLYFYYVSCGQIPEVYSM